MYLFTFVSNRFNCSSEIALSSSCTTRNGRYDEYGSSGDDVTFNRSFSFTSHQCQLSPVVPLVTVRCSSHVSRRPWKTTPWTLTNLRPSRSSCSAPRARASHPCSLRRGEPTPSRPLLAPALDWTSAFTFDLFIICNLWKETGARVALGGEVPSVLLARYSWQPGNRCALAGHCQGRQPAQYYHFRTKYEAYYILHLIVQGSARHWQDDVNPVPRP